MIKLEIIPFDYGIFSFLKDHRYMRKTGFPAWKNSFYVKNCKCFPNKILGA